MANRKGEREVFGAAVLASAVLHLAVIAAVPGWHDVRRPSVPAPFTARLAPQAHPGAQLAETPDISSLAPPDVSGAQRPPAPRRRDAVREVPTPAARFDSAPQGVTESGASHPASQVPEPVAREARAWPQGDTASAPPAMPASAIATLSQYRLAVMARARGVDRYPRVAIENAWQGRCDLRLRVAADGGVESVDLEQGSGYAVLDRAAVAMIVEAGSRVPIPESLRGREFAIGIPVIFSLQSAVR